LTLHPKEQVQLLQVAQETEKPAAKLDAAKRSDKKSIDKAAQQPYSDGNEEKPVLTETEQAIVALLQNGQQPVDNIIAATGLSAGLVLATLTMLEVKGVVCSLPGKRVVLKSQK
jgi:predicted Rossmann fold nucleotide-binding protein DprA/Smf involved in DNA uptake